jgi:hypothetical protein
MKAMAFVPAALTALLALNVSTATAQKGCTNEYQACMTACASKPVKATQDGCFSGCETKNNLCTEKIYGKRPINGTQASGAEPKAPAKEALAKKDGEQDAGQPAEADPADQRRR